MPYHTSLNVHVALANSKLRGHYFLIFEVLTQNLFYVGDPTLAIPDHTNLPYDRHASILVKKYTDRNEY